MKLKQILIIFYSCTALQALSISALCSVHGNPSDTLFLSSDAVDSTLVLNGFISESCYLGFEVFDQLGRRLIYGLDSTKTVGAFSRRYDLRKLPKGSFVFFSRCSELRRAFKIRKWTHQSKARLNAAPLGRK